MVQKDTRALVSFNPAPGDDSPGGCVQMNTCIGVLCNDKVSDIRSAA